MPITTITSYIPTMQAFAQHWSMVNATLGASPILLKGAYSLANFNTDITNMQAAFTNVINMQNAFENAGENVQVKKRAIAVRLPQFNRIARAMLIGTGYLRALPKVLSTTVAEGYYLTSLEDMKSLWATINADTTVPGFVPPIIIAGGYTQANFVTELTALRVAYLALHNSEVSYQKTLGDRNVLLRPAFDRMIQYREIILGRYVKTDPFATSLPRLTPLPGSRPLPVTNILFTFNTAHDLVTFNFTPSTSANIVRYDLFYSPPPKFDVNNALLAGTCAANLHTITTGMGIEDPGNIAYYKIVTVNATGNERSSKSLKVTRPL